MARITVADLRLALPAVAFTAISAITLAAMRPGDEAGGSATAAAGTSAPAAGGAHAVETRATATTVSPSTSTTTTPLPASQSTTTAAGPASQSTTTTTNGLPASAIAAPATRATKATPSTRAASSASRAELQQVEAIADASGFAWRSAGVSFHIGFHPKACCHWGIFDFRDGSAWIGPTAFASTTRLRYVVLHELGHAWQWSTGNLAQLKADMAPWGYRGAGALEASADCVATVWGAARNHHYWACPSTAQAILARRLKGDWSD